MKNNIKTLYVNGCSWTFGSELQFDTRFKQRILDKNNWHAENIDDQANWNILDNNGQYVGRFDEYYNEFNWAGKLKRLFGATVLVNEALGGGSNNRIVRKTLEFVKTLPVEERATTFIVLGWTHCGRSEINVGNGWHKLTARPFTETADRLKFDNEFVINKLSKSIETIEALTYSDYPGIQYYFNSVYMLSTLLTHLGIRHYFFNGLPIWYTGGESTTDVDVETVFANDLTWHNNSKNLHNIYDSFFIYANSKTDEWPLAPGLHPLSKCHEAWANYLFEIIKAKRIL